MQKRQGINAQAGIAIGLILLAVVLIGATVSAIAVSASDSRISGQKEEDYIKVQAISLNMIRVKQAIERYEVVTGSSIETGSDSDVDINTLIDLGFLPDGFNLFTGFANPEEIRIFGAGMGTRSVMGLKLDDADFDSCLSLHQIANGERGAFNFNRPGDPLTLPPGMDLSELLVFDVTFLSDPGNIGCALAGAALYYIAVI